MQAVNYRMKKTLLLSIIIFIVQDLAAQKVKDFFYVEPKNKNLPVFVRGNLSNHKILLFVQGGTAANGIDFGRSDYPKWKKTLETKVAIAYFDQRGLNKPVRKIDTSQINAAQVNKDIIAIAKKLREKYKAEIYLFGHSSGGQDVLDCLASFPEAAFIKAGIAFNAPITTDYSPERYNHYRPLYLKNLAKEFIAGDKDNSNYWQEALEWMVKTDSIYDQATSRQWNIYVNNAFTPAKRKIGPGMVFKVIFSRPYHPIKYLNKKDNKKVSDILWKATSNLNLWEQLPKIEHPVLLLSGRFDDIAVPEEQMAAHKLIKRSQVSILPDCGHESFLDQPELFETKILEFIDIQ